MDRLFNYLDLDLDLDLDLGLKSTKATTPVENIRSSIELGFPHIARNLTQLWKTQHIDEYMESLLIDKRGGRRGFPEDTQEELMFLSSLLWQMHHDGRIVPEADTLSTFSFAAANESDMRRSGTTGGWVLV